MIADLLLENSLLLTESSKGDKCEQRHAKLGSFFQMFFPSSINKYNIFHPPALTCLSSPSCWQLMLLPAELLSQGENLAQGKFLMLIILNILSWCAPQPATVAFPSVQFKVDYLFREDYIAGRLLWRAI